MPFAAKRRRTTKELAPIRTCSTRAFRPRRPKLPRSLLYRDTNLPPCNPNFVGREKLKARVREFVSRPQADGT
jgi:hypothetical protein